MKMDRDEKISNIGKVKALFEELGVLFPRYLTSGIDVHVGSIKSCQFIIFIIF